MTLPVNGEALSIEKGMFGLVMGLFPLRSLSLGAPLGLSVSVANEHLSWLIFAFLNYRWPKVSLMAEVTSLAQHGRENMCLNPLFCFFCLSCAIVHTL